MKKERGFIFPLAMYLFLLAAVIVVVLLLVQVTDLGSVKSEGIDKQALYLADGGIEEGIYTLKQNGGFLWQLGSVDYGPTACNGGSSCWGTRIAGDYYTDADQSMITPEITMPPPPPLTNTLYLSFANWYKTEDNVDGGFVEVSLDGGISWSDVSCTATNNWYAGQLDTSSPYDSHEAANTAFSGNAGTANNAIAWSTAACNLTDATYQGQTVMFRFHFWANGSTNLPGWYIDDVYVCNAAYGAPYQCGGGTTLFNDDMESGIGAWVNLVVDYPEDFGTALVSVSSEESTAEYDTFVMNAKGKLNRPSHTKKARATVSVHGNNAPFTVKVHSWKRYF